MKRLLLLISTFTLLCSLSCKNDNKILIVEKNLNIVDSDSKLTESIGIETLGGVFTSLIQKESKIPIEISQVFSTASDNQDQIKISLFRGTDSIAKNNHFIGEYQVVNILPVPRGEPQIEIKIGVNDNFVWISAFDLKSKQNMNVVKNIQ